MKNLSYVDELINVFWFEYSPRGTLQTVDFLSFFSIINLSLKPTKMTEKKAAEDLMLRGLLDRLKVREEGDIPVQIVRPPKHIDEVLERTQRAAALSSNSHHRVVRRFLNETDPDKH